MCQASPNTTHKVLYTSMLSLFNIQKHAHALSYFFLYTRQQRRERAQSVALCADARQDSVLRKGVLAHPTPSGRGVLATPHPVRHPHRWHCHCSRGGGVTERGEGGEVVMAEERRKGGVVFGQGTVKGGAAGGGRREVSAFCFFVSFFDLPWW